MTKINLPTLLEESMVSAMTEFTETAIQEAVLSTIKDTGYITESEYNLIRNFVEKVVLEAADDFVPEEKDIADLIKKLEAAGYKVELEAEKVSEDKGEEAPEACEEAPEACEEAPEDGEEAPKAGEEAPEDGEEAPEAGEAVVAESASLADKIAAKLNIL